VASEPEEESEEEDEEEEEGGLTGVFVLCFLFSLFSSSSSSSSFSSFCLVCLEPLWIAVAFAFPFVFVFLLIGPFFVAGALALGGEPEDAARVVAVAVPTAFGKAGMTGTSMAGTAVLAVLEAAAADADPELIAGITGTSAMFGAAGASAALLPGHLTGLLSEPEAFRAMIDGPNFWSFAAFFGGAEAL